MRMGVSEKKWSSLYAPQSIQRVDGGKRFAMQPLRSEAQGERQTNCGCMAVRGEGELVVACYIVFDLSVFCVWHLTGTEQNVSFLHHLAT